MGKLSNGCWAMFDLVALPLATAISVATGEDGAVDPYVDDLKTRVRSINDELRALRSKSEASGAEDK